MMTRTVLFCFSMLAAVSFAGSDALAQQYPPPTPTARPSATPDVDVDVDVGVDVEDDAVDAGVGAAGDDTGVRGAVLNQDVGAETLPRTGSSIAILALWGVLFALVGRILIVSARRRLPRPVLPAQPVARVDTSRFVARLDMRRLRAQYALTEWDFVRGREA